MNKFTTLFLASALALPTLAVPAMAQQQPGHSQQQGQKKDQPSKGHSTKAKSSSKGYKSFKKGEKFDKSRARNYQIVNYRSYKKLPAPKAGYRYVRAGSDILLIGTSSLKIYAVYTGMIK